MMRTKYKFNRGSMTMIIAEVVRYPYHCHVCNSNADADHQTAVIFNRHLSAVWFSLSLFCLFFTQELRSSDNILFAY